jgi:peptidoglycan/LPS O-acetylase OafA/YrhL
MKSTENEILRVRRLSTDALRGVAAMGVVLYHAVLQTENVVPNNFFQRPVKLLQFGSSFGYNGVFLFFVIRVSTFTCSGRNRKPAGYLLLSA